MATYVPAIIWIISAIVCYYIAKVRKVKPNLVRNFIVVFLGPLVIQFCLTSRKFCLLILLSVSCNIQAMDQISDPFNQVLSSAINGDKKQLQQIIHEGGSIDVVDSRGRSAVLVVTIENNIEALRLLIELGADVDYYDKSKSQGVIN
ncbi:MAG: hypothetical protein JKY90_03095, partial [Gammaproteobacteria bacterium]|nr:hypothetical protein [Gammaproteobacteria bacterium]